MSKMSEEMIVIRAYVRYMSEAIHAIKQKAGKDDKHIHPKHELWKSYVGLKREATLWLATLHVEKRSSCEACWKAMRSAFKGYDILKLFNEGVRRRDEIRERLRDKHGRERMIVEMYYTAMIKEVAHA